jgi:hypothetical protein
MFNQHMCRETGRSFSTAEEARASESRFCHILAECDAGRIPDLRQGDVIYVDTELYVFHGRDDFCGGLAEVIEYLDDTSAGKPNPFVVVAQEPDARHNWRLLAAAQRKLRAEFGARWAHPDPDYRPEFNE